MRQYACKLSQVFNRKAAPISEYFFHHFFLKKIDSTIFIFK